MDAECAPPTPRRHKHQIRPRSKTVPLMISSAPKTRGAERVGRRGMQPGCPGVARFIPRAAGQACGVRRAPRRVYFPWPGHATGHVTNTCLAASTLTDCAIRLRTAPAHAVLMGGRQRRGANEWCLKHRRCPRSSRHPPAIRRPLEKPGRRDTSTVPTIAAKIYLRLLCW